MSTRIAAALVLCMSVGWACASSQEPPAAPDRVEFVLSETGVGGFVAAPEHARVEIVGDRVYIDGGEQFSVILERGELDLQAERNRVIDAQRLSLDEFVRHDEHTLVWRWGPGDPGRFVHFVYVDVVGGVAFHCRSHPQAKFSRRAIEAMLEACRTVTFVAGH